MKRSYSVIFAVLLLLLTVFPALADDPIVGEIRMYAVQTPIPDGWALADGSLVSSTTYTTLCGMIKVNYGTAPTGYCKLPDFRGRNPVGQDQSNSLFDYFGETGGAISHTLTIGEMPAHNHNAYTYYGSGGSHNWAISGGGNNQAGLTTSSTGGGQPHQILDPYLTINFIIYTGVYSATPTPTATATPTETPTPTATPTGSVTPSATTTSTLYLPYIVTTTLQSGTVLSVPEQVSFGQIITSGIVLSLLAVVALDFLFRLVYRR